MEENIVLEEIIDEYIYRSPENDEIIYSELNNNILAFVSSKNPTYLKIFNIDEKKIIRTIKTNYKITLIKFNPYDASQFACASSASEKKLIIVLENNEPIIHDSTGIINSIVWSPDGNKIAYNSGKDIVIRDLENNILYKTLYGHSKTILSIDWNNNKIISGGKDKIIIWDIKNNFSKKEIKNIENNILKLIPNNNYLISYNYSYIKIFDIDGKLINIISTTFNNYNITFNIYNITFLLNSNKFLCSSKKGYILFNYNINNIIKINVDSILLLENKFINFYQNNQNNL